MDIEGKVRCGVVKRASRGGLAKTALRASTLTALGLLLALAMLLPNAAAEAQSSPATATATPPTPDHRGHTTTATATATATATPTDYDSDDDGLIDIKTLAQLNAVRYDLDGDAKQDTVSTTAWAIYTAAFPNPASGMGCKPDDHDDDATTALQPVCDGYELMADLDFDTDGDGDVDASDTNSYPNWTPIGTSAKPFESNFEGSLTNGVMPKISNLKISGGATEAGLFGATGETAHIENVGLVDVNVNTTTSARNAKISALVGNNAGRITACYVTGKISAGAGAYPDAGGLVGYNGGTIAASFSRATVYMSSGSEIYVGGLVGYNGGTITATYSAGAVKGKGGSGFVGGLAGYNVGTINASYSIAPVTSVDADPTNIRTSEPAVLGLSYNQSGYSTVTNSYWDVIASGVPDDADRLMPEGKTTGALAHSTVGVVIYTGWNTLTIDEDGTNDDAPWEFFALPEGEVYEVSARYPKLTYGGHTTDQSGNQRFASIRIGGYQEIANLSRLSIQPKEGMIIRSGGAAGYPLQATTGVWIWESSPDGIDWTTLSPLPGKDGGALRGMGGNSSNTHFFIPRSEHVGKYIRAKILLTTGDYLVSRAIGKIKATAHISTLPSVPSTPLGFASGNPPLVEKAITIPSSLPLVGADQRVRTAVVLWYRCDTNNANPPSTGCELVGSRSSYTPDSADLGHYLYAHIYYREGLPSWVRTNTGFTQQPVAGHRESQWRMTAPDNG